MTLYFSLMPSHLALLRGINVGGNNLIRMTDLKTAFEDMGCRNVATYIQSGNVVFDPPVKGSTTPVAARARIEAGLSERFGYQAKVLILTRSALQAAVEGAPQGFGDDPELHRHDVIFPIVPLTAPALLRVILELGLKPEVDTVHAGRNAVYFRRLTARAAQSRLTKLIGLPAYQSVTIRNWNTTTRLLKLMEP